jgi:hypothetical protein
MHMESGCEKYQLHFYFIESSQVNTKHSLVVGILQPIT